MQTDASVGSITVHTTGMIGAVNADHREAQANPVFAERIVRSGVDFVLDVFARFLLFALDRGGHAPGRIFFQLDHFECASRRAPLFTRLPDRDRIRPAQTATLEVKQHPLRQVDLDQVGSFDRNDVAIVDMNRVAGIQPIAYALAIFASQDLWTLTESRTDPGEAVVVPDDEIELTARDSMRYRRKQRGGLFGPESGSRE